LRAIGASANDIVSTLLLEALALGALGGVGGLVGARLTAWLCNLASARWVPDFPFKPDNYFSFEWWILAGALTASLGASVLGAFFPARAAGRVDPCEALGAPL
jgi:ABC-type antimicrobial peptide transport system permease subunit